MGPEELFLVVVALLPVAAASGWYFGRREAMRGGLERAGGSTMSPDYFRGLNYLLHDRPDKAIEVFLKVLEVEADTVETHLALGSLFRRRGEVDRAIRIHQNLVARPTLEASQRALALLELGLDYMRSGLFDRAESLFAELLDIGMYEQQALRHLVDIYQQEQDWDKAIEFSRRLEAATGENLNSVRAHFLCEKAQAELDHNPRADVQELLDQALSTDRKCVRASLMVADLSFAKGEYERTIQALKKVEHQDLDFLPEVVPRLIKAYRAVERIDDLCDYLASLAALRAGISPVLALAELTAERVGEEVAKRYIINELKIRPTIRGIDRLIDYALTNAGGESREDLLLLKETALRLIAGKASYKCGNCGFAGRAMHWQCPSCKSWNTVKPIHGIEGE
ncbi:MAG: lipopolysaccharide assembly protein LapB [Gammaproteobacteria bacterium]|nr:lipopolysaccharide assembly protein LapB [Gammaproteobacteria bacterium]MBI5614807.1 lipopolysaccharide assembly protein LapB [Gammaproteobacteria bacterium]